MLQQPIMAATATVAAIAGQSHIRTVYTCNRRVKISLKESHHFMASRVTFIQKYL